MPLEMESQTEHWAVVATTPDERLCAELALVLTARGFEHQKLRTSEGWQLAVPIAVAGVAAGELAAYRAENSRAVGPRRLEELGFGLPGVVAYCLTLMTVFICVRQNALGLDWYGAGRLVVGRVEAGEWWRTVTALTVHLDLDHLGGNLVFGAFFGYFAGRYLGGGVGWLAILGSATLGNVLNVFAQAPQHRSIGASTAVFAALGLLTAYTWRRGFLRETPWRARIAPIVAGIALLAFTGTGGENTDVFAHLTGFVAGFGCALLLARYAPHDMARLRKAQRACALAAALVVVAAWGWGLWAAG
jgi:membrane associated rhomboid family serine protease